MADKDIQDLQEAFYNFDGDQRGFIHIEELRVIVTTDGEPMPDVEEFLSEAMQFADHNGMVDYKSFASCMLSND